MGCGRVSTLRGVGDLCGRSSLLRLLERGDRRIRDVFEMAAVPGQENASAVERDARDEAVGHTSILV